MKVIKVLSLALIIASHMACNSDDDATILPNQNNIVVEEVLTIEDDRNALIEIYNANTNNTLGWDITTTDVSTWGGVTVENDRVAVLNIGQTQVMDLPTTAMQKLTELRHILFNDNGITSLDISNNLKLKNAQLFNNQLTNIDVSNNILLEQLLLENNDLETLDVSMLGNLTDLKGGSNNFTNSVNIANGNNSNMFRMELASITLSCVQVDTGATSGYTGWSISASASYNTNCQ